MLWALRKAVVEFYIKEQKQKEGKKQKKEKLNANVNAALKDGVEQDVDNHKARFACIISASCGVLFWLW